jgi:hypothetical protein
LQEFVSSEETEFICTLLLVSSCEKTTSGNIERHNTKTRQAFNKRTRFIFMTVIKKFRNISAQTTSMTVKNANYVPQCLKKVKRIIKQ